MFSLVNEKDIETTVRYYHLLEREKFKNLQLAF